MSGEVIGVVIEFISTAVQYAIVFGMGLFGVRMLVRAFTGKERFL